MSEQLVLSKTKEKKAQRDAERKNNKSKQRKAVAVQGSDTVQEQKVSKSAKSEYEIDAGGPKEDIRQTSTSKKRKQSDLEDDDATAVKSAAAPQPKKRRKPQTPSQDNSDKAITADGALAEQPAKLPTPATKSRFILFVGNLPYSTTDVALNLHFAKLFPYTLRHRTDPKTKKSKGFAFLEFENYDRMKTCLSQYHHSMFDPESRELGGHGKGNGKGGRKINVELTAGGGGKTEGRKEKIRAKNERLEGQRERRAEAERKEKIRKERKEALKAGKEPKGEDESTSMNVAGQESELQVAKTSPVQLGPQIFAIHFDCHHGAFLLALSKMIPIAEGSAGIFGDERRRFTRQSFPYHDQLYHTITTCKADPFYSIKLGMMMTVAKAICMRRRLTISHATRGLALHCTGRSRWFRSSEGLQPMIMAIQLSCLPGSGMVSLMSKKQRSFMAKVRIMPYQGCTTGLAGLGFAAPPAYANHS
nr:putative rna-binding protein [Quercus suber]